MMQTYPQGISSVDNIFFPLVIILMTLLFVSFQMAIPSRDTQDRVVLYAQLTMNTSIPLDSAHQF
jgi:hypothetical protein